MSYTLEQARQVMAETQRLLDKDARLKPDPREARAAATTDPPERRESFHDVVARFMKEGKSQSEATRLASIERPDLRDTFVKASNESRRLQEEVDKATARRNRDRNR